MLVKEVEWGDVNEQCASVIDGIRYEHGMTEWLLLPGETYTQHHKDAKKKKKISPLFYSKGKEERK